MRAIATIIGLILFALSALVACAPPPFELERYRPAIERTWR